MGTRQDMQPSSSVQGEFWEKEKTCLDPDQEGIKLHMCRLCAMSWESSLFQQFSGGEMKGSQ